MNLENRDHSVSPNNQGSFEFLPNSQEEIELATKPVTNIKRLEGRGFTNRVYVADLNNGKKAIFKEESAGHQNERLAFLVDKYLGAGLVPTTVLRTLVVNSGDEPKIKDGSMQEFIVDGVTIDFYKKDIRKFDEMLRALFVFDYTIWNTDRHSQNLMIKISTDDGLFAIDHGLAFKEYIGRYLRVFNTTRFISGLPPGQWGESEIYPGFTLLDNISIPDIVAKKYVDLNNSKAKREALRQISNSLVSDVGAGDALIQRLSFMADLFEQNGSVIPKGTNFNFNPRTQ